jgi:dephospho-CoA kinase
MVMSGGRPWVVGLTGGIGSGKSTVAALLAEHGVPVLDLDAVGHAVLMTHAGVRQALVDAFGPGVLNADGSPDRERLGREALASDAGARRLGAIVHPHIWREAEAWVACQQAPYVVIEASVLIESGSTGRVDDLVVVLADLETRRRRTVARERQSEADFARIVARQCHDVERRRLAGHLLVNDGDRAALAQAVAALHAELAASAAMR